MGTFTLTAAELHNELAEMQAHRTAFEATRISEQETAFEMTTAEALAFEMAVCPEEFERMVTFAARRAVYGWGVWEAEAAAELGDGLVHHTKERRVARLVEEVVEVITASTRPKNKYSKGFALTAAFEATVKNAEAIRPIKASVKPITVGATAIYRDDTTSLVRESVARTISKRYANGTAAPFSAAPAAAYRVLAGIEALATYLVGLPEPLAIAEFKDLGVELGHLYDEAADALDTLRYGQGVTQKEGRAARALAAFRAELEGMTADEQADAWRAREEQIAEWAESNNEGYRRKAAAAERAPEVLDLRGGVSMDAEDSAQFDGAASTFDEEYLASAWASIAPQFGYSDPGELAAAVTWRTDGHKASKALSTYFNSSNSRPYRAATARAQALDIAAVRVALAEELITS
ncbi:hypothetical protein [Microbacterium hydrocarbonoxydans]|uniref:hypothetical protein n=1 Tax=Microbacterium hydrocarbonoxydans TaxID=273678 RepID=UPI003D969E03